MLFAKLDVTFEKYDPYTRSVRILASTTNKVAGSALKKWDLSRFQKNPVILWAHNANELPLGLARDVAFSPEEGLSMTVFFGSEAANPKADRVAKCVAESLVRAVSVGYTEEKGGISVLDEVSFVSIGLDEDAGTSHIDPAHPQNEGVIQASARMDRLIDIGVSREDAVTIYHAEIARLDAVSPEVREARKATRGAVKATATANKSGTWVDHANASMAHSEAARQWKATPDGKAKADDHNKESEAHLRTAEEAQKKQGASFGAKGDVAKGEQASLPGMAPPAPAPAPVVSKAQAEFKAMREETEKSGKSFSPPGGDPDVKSRVAERATDRAESKAKDLLDEAKGAGRGSMLDDYDHQALASAHGHAADLHAAAAAAHHAAGDHEKAAEHEKQGAAQDAKASYHESGLGGGGGGQHRDDHGRWDEDDAENLDKGWLNFLTGSGDKAPADTLSRVAENASLRSETQNGIAVATHEAYNRGEAYSKIELMSGDHVEVSNHASDVVEKYKNALDANKEAVDAHQAASNAHAREGNYLRADEHDGIANSLRLQATTLRDSIAQVKASEGAKEKGGKGADAHSFLQHLSDGGVSHASGGAAGGGHGGGGGQQRDELGRFA